MIVATHIPATGSQHVREGRQNPNVGTAIMNREALFRLLEPFQAHILTGHTHECEHVFEGGAHEHVTGAICGAWWSGPICFDGTPSGYCLYEVAGSEVTWRYKATGESVLKMKEGDVLYHDARDMHLAKNVGDVRARYITVGPTLKFGEN